MADVKLIEVYAFVGPAGTGKSQRAINVAREYNIDLIIDDGLVISRGGRQEREERDKYGQGD